MEAVAGLHHRHRPLHLSLHHHRPSFSTPISSLCFRTPPPPSSPKLSVSIGTSTSSSSFSDPLLPQTKAPKPQFAGTLNPFLFPLLKTTLVAAVTATAILFARVNLKPAFADVISPPPAVDTAAEETVSDEEKENALEEHLASHPDDIQALRNLMEAKIKSQKLEEAFLIADLLIGFEPDNVALPLMKAHMYCFSGDYEMAQSGFNEILKKDPLRIEAYHGLLTVATKTGSSAELKVLELRIRKAMKLCEIQKKDRDLRNLKLMIAQIRTNEGSYNDALKVYEELVKEEPKDFRPYLCQGIIYTLLRKRDEAEQQFKKYRSLVPKGSPYADYFDADMMATKLFAQKVENEKMGFKG